MHTVIEDLEFLTFILCVVCMSLCVYLNACEVTLRGQKIALILPELELPAVMSHTTWMLGTKFQSLRRAGSPLHMIVFLML